MWYWVFQAIVRVIAKLFFALKVEGIENVPVKTNFIVVANHTSSIDPFVIESAIPRKIHCIVLRGLYNIFGLSWFFRLKEALPSGDGSSERALKFLLRNEVVGLFPEGGRSLDGKLKEFRRGAAVLAVKTGRPILPCAIIGAYEALPRGALLPRLCRIKVKIGKPIYLLKQFEEVVDDIDLQDGMLRVKNVIKEMLNAG
jgi:1-acyl-sn-glycerol-3-phosphate acyltransferase